MKPLLFLLLLTSPAIATVTLTISSNGGPAYATSTGGLLADGSLVRVGWFDLSDAGVLATLQSSHDYHAVSALFTSLANAGGIFQSGNSGDEIIINSQFAPGQVFGQITGISATTLPAGADLSVWVFNASIASEATEWGIFSAWNPLASDDGWEFPADLGAQTLATFEVSTIIRGSHDLIEDELRLAAVPEPGSLMLLALGLVMMCRRKKAAAC